MPDTSSSLSEWIVGSKYSLGKRLGAGTFGEIHYGRDVTNGEEVAVKLENRLRAGPSQLSNEFEMYKILKGKIGNGIPHVKWLGNDSSYNILVMDYLGPSLEDLFNFCSRKFSLKTTLLIALQMMDIIEYVHGRHIIHRDLKPENFLMGNDQYRHKIFLVDFGLAKLYWDSKSRTHIENKEGRNLTGTVRYSSINAHRGYVQSRRDDMESLGYVLIYLSQGCLPWQGIRPSSKKQLYEMTGEKKMYTPIKELCQSLPTEFVRYLEYCRGLEFDEMPKYRFLRGLFSSAFSKNKFVRDFKFDWYNGK